MGLKFYYKNKFDDVASGDLVTSSAAPAYPKSYLQNAFRKKPWRSTGITGEFIKWDFGSSENCSHISLINYNLTMDATITITASDNADFSLPLLSTTYDVWDYLFGFGEGGFGENGFGGYLIEADREELAGGTIKIKSFTTVVARYWKVAFTDASNADGYIEVGRVLTGIPWEVKHHMDYDWTITPLDESDLVFSQGGQIWTDKKPKRYQVEFDFAGITDLEKYWSLIDMLRRWGKRKSIMLELLPDGSAAEHFFTTLYGRFQEIPSVNQKFIDYSHAQVIFTEDL